MTRPEPVLSLRGVTCRVGGRDLLRELTWEIAPGEHWAVLGLNGSGKTTLLKLVNGYAHPAPGGRMTVLGNEWGRRDWRDVRTRIGFVSAALQEHFSPAETAEAIVLSGLHATLRLLDEPGPAERARARELLAELGAAHTADQPYAELSQGERQKALIARALIAAPGLLVMDEPCAGLDLFARERVLAAIGALAARPAPPAMIYVSHHVEEILPAFTHTLLLRAGRVFAAGPTDEVLTAGTLRDFFDRPVIVTHADGRTWLRPA
jgi:iron complex transport system ATP-binding protein